MLTLHVYKFITIMSEILLIQLPLDVLVNIVKHLNLLDLRNVMLTCKSLRDLIINENSIWRSIYLDRLILHNTLDNRRPFTLSCYNLCRISHNWCKGVYRSKVVVYHQINYMPWLKFHNSEALVVSTGSELRCYSAADKKGFPNCKDIHWKLDVPIVARNDVRTNDISRFIIKKDLLVCGNRDGCFSLYKLDNIQQKPNFIQHIKDCHENGELEVTAVELVNNTNHAYVVTASNYSPQLCFWYFDSDENSDNNMSTPVRDFQLRFDDTKVSMLSGIVGVKCLAINQMEDKLAIGPNGNSKPILLDVNKGDLLMTGDAISNRKQAVRDMQWHNENTVMYVTHSGKLQLIDIRTGEVVYDVMDPFQSTLYCVKSDNHNAVVVGSSEYSRCVLFDTRKSAHHVQMYFTQKKSSPVYSLDFDATKLIAAADRSIAALNFNINSATAQHRDYSHAFEFINS